MADLTTQNIVYAGTAPTFSAAAASDTAEVGKGKFVIYKNSSTAVDVVITVPTDNTPYSQTSPDVTYSVPNTGEVWIPLHSDYDTGAGRATLTPADETNLTVAVVHAGWSE